MKPFQPAGFIFDFNGTLFWDTEYHNRAWDGWLGRYGFAMTDTEKDIRVHGRNNRDIFEDIFGRPMESAEAWRYTEEKERLYREICLRDGMALAAGATELLDLLKSRGVRLTIATASGMENVRFFFNELSLDRWFSIERVICDDGLIPGKPAPDYFLRAAAALDLAPGDCAACEDSPAGLRAAHAAGIGRLFRVRTCSTGELGFDVVNVADFREIMEHLVHL